MPQWPAAMHGTRCDRFVSGESGNCNELQQADVVISPVTKEIDQTNLDDKHWAILEGEKAATAALPRIKARLGSFGER